MTGRKTGGQNDRIRVGSQGEDLAAEFLRRAGYHLRERNWRCTLGEVDLIATQGEYLVFVEVKTRVAGTPYHPTLNITAPKKARLRQLGQQYLADHPEAVALQPRFDVMAVELEGHHPEGEVEGRVEHFINAF